MRNGVMRQRGQRVPNTRFCSHGLICSFPRCVIEWYRGYQQRLRPHRTGVDRCVRCALGEMGSSGKSRSRLRTTTDVAGWLSLSSPHHRRAHPVLGASDSSQEASSCVCRPRDRIECLARSQRPMPSSIEARTTCTLLHPPTPRCIGTLDSAADCQTWCTARSRLRR
jgi:hypothetical protein